MSADLIGGALKRISKELKECEKQSDISGVSAHLVVEGKLDHLEGIIIGPEETPYEHGEFKIDIQIPQNYPFEPPKMKFKNKIWHPNVSSQTGAICLDILRDQWSPALTIKTALLSIQALLSAAEPTDPQDAQVAAMYMKDYATFLSTARLWTQMHAKAGQAEAKSPSVIKLMDMGFAEDVVRKALDDHSGDEANALEQLLHGV